MEVETDLPQYLVRQAHTLACGEAPDVDTLSCRVRDLVRLEDPQTKQFKRSKKNGE